MKAPQGRIIILVILTKVFEKLLTHFLKTDRKKSFPYVSVTCMLLVK